jgi:hypothetical protein
MCASLLSIFHLLNIDFIIMFGCDLPPFNSWTAAAAAAAVISAE